MSEQWRPVVGFEHLYEVSDLGRVRSIPRYARNVSKKGKEGVRWRPGKVLKAALEKGYERVALTDKNGGAKMHMVHHLVYEAYNGPRTEGLVIAHDDGVKTNNTPGNLVEKSQKANVEDKFKHGTMQRGEEIATAKLTTTEVLAIKRGLARGERHVALAARFGVSRWTIADISTGRRWSWLEEEGTR